VFELFCYALILYVPTCARMTLPQMGRFSAPHPNDRSVVFCAYYNNQMGYLQPF
jgi:hypothetical protein